MVANSSLFNFWQETPSNKKCVTDVNGGFVYCAKFQSITYRMYAHGRNIVLFSLLILFLRFSFFLRLVRLFPMFDDIFNRENTPRKGERVSENIHMVGVYHYLNRNAHGLFYVTFCWKCDFSKDIETMKPTITNVTCQSNVCPQISNCVCVCVSFFPLSLSLSRQEFTRCMFVCCVSVHHSNIKCHICYQILDVWLLH